MKMRLMGYHSIMLLLHINLHLRSLLW